MDHVTKTKGAREKKAAREFSNHRNCCHVYNVNFGMFQLFQKNCHGDALKQIVFVRRARERGEYKPNTDWANSYSLCIWGIVYRFLLCEQHTQRRTQRNNHAITNHMKFKFIRKTISALDAFWFNGILPHEHFVERELLFAERERERTFWFYYLLYKFCIHVISGYNIVWKTYGFRYRIHDNIWLDSSIASRHQFKHTQTQQCYQTTYFWIHSNA